MNRIEAPLPDVHDALLDPPALAELLADIAACTTVLAVSVRGESVLPVTPEITRAVLARIERRLLDGSVRGVQVRYLHEGQEWWDTLVPQAPGVRLVRIAHPIDPDPA